MGAAEVEAFLTYLAAVGQVTVSATFAAPRFVRIHGHVGGMHQVPGKAAVVTKTTYSYAAGSAYSRMSKTQFRQRLVRMNINWKAHNASVANQGTLLLAV